MSFDRTHRSASAINRSSFASLFIALTLRFAHHGVSRSQAYRARRVSSPIGRAGGHKSVGEEVVVELLEIIEYRTVVTSLDVTTYAGRRCVAALAPCSFSASWDPGLRFGEERDGHARRVGYPASPWLSGIPRQARLHPVRKRIESPIKQDSHCWATGQTLVEQRAGDQLRVASEQGSRHIQPWPCRHAGHSQCHSLFTVDECFTMLPVGDAVESLDCARRSAIDRSPFASLSSRITEYQDCRHGARRGANVIDRSPFAPLFIALSLRFARIAGIGLVA
ncbi:hypothetical protein AcV5_005173 [Taiwanofungus camphoratus]|nr:hypothetical protein AcV5_005173 [Antrodia cinnamomea]